MRLGFVVNDVQTEQAGYTTTRLAMKAVQMGHECWELGVGDFIYAANGSICAVARTVQHTNYDDLAEFLEELQSEEAREERITVDELDVVMMRYDPAEEQRERPWAQTAGILFGEMAASRGVIVLNDPRSLANAINKTYFQHFPDLVRPRTCISRNVTEIKQFISEQHDKVVIKPLQGSGGQSVFLIREDDAANLNQMIEAVTRDGYCIVQEYLAGAAKGDVRMFVMNGRPLMRDGKYAAFRRVSKSGDLRSNMHTGGESQAGARRDVPRRAGHRGRQADGGERVHARRAGERGSLDRSGFYGGHHRGVGAEGSLPVAVWKADRERGHRHLVSWIEPCPRQHQRSMGLVRRRCPKSG
jgi:glutathione synthase